MIPPFGYTFDDYDLDNQNHRHYQNNNVLVNRFGVNDTSTLNKLECDYSDIRFSEVIKSKEAIEFTTSYYTSIHKYIFQDVYPWAGETRLIDTMKGDSLFTPFQHIHKDLNAALKKLENNLNSDSTKKGIGNSLGVFLGEVNRIHPFAEGNGRTQRAFLSRYIIDKEYTIDWNAISSERMKEASIYAHSNNLEPMIKLVQNALIDKDKSLTLAENIVPHDNTENNFYLHYQSQVNEVKGVIANISDKYVVIKSTDNYIVLNRQEFEPVIPSLAIGESVNITPYRLSENDYKAIDLLKKAFAEKYKNDPVKLEESLKKIDDSIPDIASGKITLPQPPAPAKKNDKER